MFKSYHLLNTYVFIDTRTKEFTYIAILEPHNKLRLQIRKLRLGETK